MCYVFWSYRLHKVISTLSICEFADEIYRQVIEGWQRHHVHNESPQQSRTKALEEEAGPLALEVFPKHISHQELLVTGLNNRFHHIEGVGNEPAELPSQACNDHAR